MKRQSLWTEGGRADGESWQVEHAFPVTRGMAGKKIKIENFSYENETMFRLYLA
ncbi:hypothetical protein [Microvirga sp. TS319]|uniref:hypothetical protein n=1 Tax=Microvirga sp. TS319 TaxID=3241165 RepID=UPI00351A1733